MPRARKHLVCVADTPYYHVTARCVRRAFLCGVDRYSGQSYEHRRTWVEDRIRILSSLFSISVCAYAVMSNHYHLVVKLNPEESANWTSASVLKRWTTLFRGPLLIQRCVAGKALSDIESETVRSMISVYRERLSNLSWFMKCLNEPIARRANAEDRCTGHFWESRFHSQALMSDEALIAAMAYVDLNPVRAGIATTPDQSEYTSFRARLRKDAVIDELRRAIRESVNTGEIGRFDLPIRPLMPFLDRGERLESTDRKDDHHLPISRRDYTKLVNYTGGVDVQGKRGRNSERLDSLLNRLNISSEDWPIASCGLTGYLQRERSRRRKRA